MKILKPSLLAVAWICSTPIAFADTIVMKNGDTYQGRVIREDDEHYVLEVKVSDSIRDERTVAKADVKSIDKTEQDAEAFKKISDLVPTPELLDKGGYEARMEKINSFIESHPKSKKLSAAKKMLSELEEELAIVKEGGIKFGDEMISPDDYQANAYEYDAMIADRKIRESVNRRDFIGALRRFTRYEKNFQGAAGRDELVPLIQQVLSVYGTSIEESLGSLESRLEKRETGLESMTGEDRSQTKRALAEQHERVDKRFQAEKSANQAWVTPDAFHKESLEEARRQVGNEIRRLEAVTKPAEGLETSIAEIYRETWQKLSKGTDEDKAALIGTAKSQGVPDDYLEKLQERAGIEQN